MEYFIREVINTNNEEINKTAGGKAREDIESILIQQGIKPIDFICFANPRKHKRFDLSYHYNILKTWKSNLSGLKPGDYLFIQYPIRERTFLQGFFYKKYIKRGIHVVVIVHDLLSLREHLLLDSTPVDNFKNYFQEIKLLKDCSKIIVHNSEMKKILFEKYKIPNDKLISLKIFDYLIPHWEEVVKEKKEATIDEPIVISGNLVQSKSGYAYQLPKQIKFNLYGMNYNITPLENVNYFGSFLPDELVYKMQGSFGLVWDGDSSETCSGIYGEYLKINNPHKTSLYIANELPVIIWKEAALAKFIEDNKLGFSVMSIAEISERLGNMSIEEYNEMKNNVRIYAERLRNGYYTKLAIEECHN